MSFSILTLGKTSIENDTMELIVLTLYYQLFELFVKCWWNIIIYWVIYKTWRNKYILYRQLDIKL